MRKILFLSLFFSGLMILYFNYSYAATVTATPTEYMVTVHKVELYNSETGEWVTIGEGDLTFDIASVNAGEIAGSYADGTAIPEGVYTKERTTISRTFYITASGTIGATTYYTTAGTTSLSGYGGATDGYAATATTTSPAVRGTCVLPTAWLSGFTVQGDYFYHEGNLPSPITVKKGLAKKMRIKFDVTDKVQFDDSGPGGADICYPLAPSVSFEVVD